MLRDLLRKGEFMVKIDLKDAYFTVPTWKNSCDWSKCFKTKIHPLKMEFKYIFFRKLPFCRFMHSLRKNENISM